MAKRLLIFISSDSGDAKLLSKLILVELTKAVLTSLKIFNQVYVGPSVKAGTR